MPEIVFDNADRLAGMVPAFFLSPSLELLDFKITCASGLTSLDLALDMGDNLDRSKIPRMGLLKDALSVATSLKSLSLHIHTEFGEEFFDLSLLNDLRMLEAIPVDKWSCLQTLTITGLPMALNHFSRLINLTRNLPSSFQRLEFKLLSLADMHEEGCFEVWEKLLTRCHSESSWKGSQPKIRMLVEIS